MGRTKLTDQQAGFAGGVNTVSDPAFLRPDQARNLENFRLTSFGAAFKRLGTALTTNDAITTFDTTNSVYGGIYWASQDKIYATGAATNSTSMQLWQTVYPEIWTGATWTSLGGVLQYRPVIFTDGSDPEVMYLAGDNTHKVNKVTAGGSISSLTTSTAQVIGLVVFNDRMWGWNTTNQPNALVYSQLSTIVGTTGGDSLGLVSAGGGTIIVTTFGMAAIRACVVIGSSLIILHQRGISRLTGYGQDDITVVPQALTSDVGMGNGNLSGVCVVANVAYFVTDRGIYYATESTVHALSTPDKPDPTQALLTSGQVLPSQFILQYNRQYSELWVSITGVGVYVYNTVLQSWSGPFTGTYASGTRAIFEVINSTDGSSHLWRSTYNGTHIPGFFVSECDRANFPKDDSTTGGDPAYTVTAPLQMHRMYFGDRGKSKTYRWVNILAQVTQTSGPTPVVVCTTQEARNLPPNVSTTHAFENPIGVQTDYYFSPGGYGPFIDVSIIDEGVGPPNEYALATLEAYFLGQR